MHNNNDNNEHSCICKSENTQKIDCCYTGASIPKTDCCHTGGNILDTDFRRWQTRTNYRNNYQESKKG